MSNYKQIFATASIFAIAASALVAPVANAADITINANSTGNYTYCLSGAAGSSIAPNGYNVVDTTTNTTTIYVVASTNANTTTQVCGITAAQVTAAAAETPTRVITPVTPTALKLPAMPGHTTSYDLAGSATVSTTNVKVKNTALSASNVVKTCDGIKTIYTITGTDGDEVEHVSNSIPTADYTVTPSGNKPLKITIEKKSGSTTTGVKGAFVYVKETLPTVTGAVAYTVDAVAENIQLQVDIDPTCVATVASSSMSSSSSSAAAVTSSATAAASSKATVTIEEPTMNAGKGTSTVRTGGAY
jgi:hypothetical protein